MGYRVGLVEDLEEDMTAAEACHMVDVVVVGNVAEDSFVEGNSAENGFGRVALPSVLLLAIALREI